MSSKNKNITKSKSVSKKVSSEINNKKKAKKPMAKEKLDSEKNKALPKVSLADKEKLLLQARTKRATPNIFKARKHTPIVFSLADVQELLKTKEPVGAEIPKKQPPVEKLPKKAEIRRVVTKQPVREEYKEPASQPKRFLGAASLADILGFNPKETKNKPREVLEEEKVPKHLLKYYKSLVELREHVLEGLEMHSKETLKRSSKDDSGDLSGYSQHMADAGTDTFDRDFALNLLSSEQDALFEIEEAIQRIMAGTYGICEVTGTVISKERLKAVPFTRYGLEGQRQLETTQRVNKERGSVFGESSLEDSAKYAEDFEE